MQQANEPRQTLEDRAASIPQSLSSSRSRARVKTFTGCWTCRERKVKCDELRPKCRQCTGRNLKCKGYALRLQWLAPATISEHGLKSIAACDLAAAGRRSVVFRDHKLDSLLELIETDTSTSGFLATARGPFAAFTADEAETETEKDTVFEGDTLRDNEPASTSYFANDEVLAAAEVLMNDFPQPLSADIESPTGILRVPAPTVPGETLTYGSLSSWSPGLLESSAGIRRPMTSQSLSMPSQSPYSIDNTSDMSSIGPVPTPLDAMRLPTQVRRLLHHYENHIIDLMTAVPTSKGPWKIVYLPRAVQACAELALRGTTSHARHALLHTALAISAYTLAANHKIAGKGSDGYNWRDVALGHTTQSLTYLKASLQADCPPSQRGKYKEILAVMLSMITIDVFSRETSYSAWHLKGLDDFIHAAKRKPGRRYSRKAQALHRDYVYLRVIKDSTDLRCDPLDSLPSRSSEAITEWLCRPLCFLNNLDATDEWLQESDPRSSVDLSACEIVHGFPLELLVFVYKTSDVICRRRTFARHCPDLAIPASLQAMCDNLEMEILKWPVDRIVEDIWKMPIAKESQSLVVHQTRAFYQAIIIYFSQLVRGVHRQHLQPYAESIIVHLEAVERIKHEASIIAGCISWPGFIGATVAIAENLRSRYLQLSKSLRFYELGTYETATEVVLEIWERDKADGGLAIGCDWPSIVESQNITLMLT